MSVCFCWVVVVFECMSRRKLSVSGVVCSLVFRLWVLVWGGGVSCGKERGLCVFVFLGLGKKAIELWYWVFCFCTRGSCSLGRTSAGM